MPIYNGNYVAPVWINDQPPAINETELLAMSGTIQASQVLTGTTPPTQYTGGAVGQRYADMSTSPPTIWKLQTAADEANVWVPEDGNGNLAQEYAANTGYDTGDYCIHEGYLYRANTDISGEAWTAAHWTRVYAAEELAGHEKDQQNPHNVTAEQTGALSGTVIATVESTATATASYFAGQYLILSGVLYRVTSPISQGDTITVNGNVTAAVLGDDVSAARLRVGTINLSATWQGSSPKYQTVTVTGTSVTANSHVEIQPSPAQITALLSAGTRALTVENNGGTLTAYAIGAAPGTAMTLQCVVEEVSPWGGGGGAGVSPKQVNFIDYDGTLLYSYTAQEANALTSLPDNPAHSGLTAQGWNWTLAQIKAQLTAAPDGPVWVGQMYITQSGDTEIDVSMPEGRLSPIMTIAVNGTVTVDWGDNTTADSVTGSSLTTRQAVPHTYSAAGEYTIKIHVVSGSFTFYGSSVYTILRKNTTAAQNEVYANCVRSVRIGSGITSIGEDGFVKCYSLASITIPSGVTSIGDYAFSSCYSLVSVTIPSGATSIGASAFRNSNIASAAIRGGLSNIGEYAFYGCYGLLSVTIPTSMTRINKDLLGNCRCLTSITIPSGVTSVGPSALENSFGLASVTIPSGVTSIGGYAFQYCSSLASVTIPSSVTSIGDYAFRSCTGVAEYHIKATAPPTLGTSVFDAIVSDCVIYVPSAQLADYQADSGWSLYASLMQGE
jgi:hypothetical protein